jgi:hypothetical protein
MNEPTVDDIIESLLLKAMVWRAEARRFGRSVEARLCLEHAQHAETLAELERLRALD